MPTIDEQHELLNECSWEWTELDGVPGHIVTGPNGNSIFLPAAGYRDGTEVEVRGSDGGYWSSSLYVGCSFGSSLYVGNSGYACGLGFGSVGSGWNSPRRDYGLSVRPVSE